MFLGFKKSVNDIQPIFLDIILNKLSLPISHFYFQYIYLYLLNGLYKKEKNFIKYFKVIYSLNFKSIS
ncbi:hypothetical protein J577_2675 [Acinetobacter sp. 263903-1]|uniref:Uncharacterized protein n=1 Tax=Acinetobacter radioresistens SK82 TaxID=596318 RepID=A0ABP2GR44_ACIRA|nr:hypothetical protein ACIRA0001_1130 [Acinetobacter radioresistens SK82]EXB83510.1 hypothetical protein J538_2121 [Acinetobacter sp. 272263]EXE60059.1 hypothetical protein J579_0826 [Acinetobacter sp. 1239920]EXF56855.1 hypothetical protein J502_1977 [Acinetobacter sp. 1294596]KCX36067.1 hypothetical protein J577_2675 [Acinetobacter sp. 263903-1]